MSAPSHLDTLRATPEWAGIVGAMDAEIERGEKARQILSSLATRRLAITLGGVTFHIRHPGSSEFAEISKSVIAAQHKVQNVIKTQKPEEVPGAILELRDEACMAVARLFLPGEGVTEHELRTNEYGLELALEIVTQASQRIQGGAKAVATFRRD